MRTSLTVAQRLSCVLSRHGSLDGSRHRTGRDRVDPLPLPTRTTFLVSRRIASNRSSLLARRAVRCVSLLLYLFSGALSSRFFLHFFLESTVHRPRDWNAKRSPSRALRRPRTTRQLTAPPTTLPVRFRHHKTPCFVVPVGRGASPAATAAASAAARSSRRLRNSSTETPCSASR